MAYTPSKIAPAELQTSKIYYNRYGEKTISSAFSSFVKKYDAAQKIKSEIIEAASQYINQCYAVKYEEYSPKLHAKFLRGIFNAFGKTVTAVENAKVSDTFKEFIVSIINSAKTEVLAKYSIDSEQSEKLKQITTAFFYGLEEQLKADFDKELPDEYKLKITDAMKQAVESDTEFAESDKKDGEEQDEKLQSISAAEAVLKNNVYVRQENNDAEVPELFHFGDRTTERSGNV